MNELQKLATGLWAMVDPKTPFSLNDPHQRVAVWDLLPHVKTAALQRYLAAPLYERPVLHRDLIKASRLCGELAGVLKAAAQDPPAQGTPVQAPPPQGPPPDPTQTPGQAPPAGPPGQPGDPNAQGPESHIDSVAAMIQQSLSAGGQVAPGEIANALKQAGQQDLQEMMGTIQQQIDEHVAMYVQQLTAPQPQQPMPGQPPLPGQPQGQPPGQPAGQQPGSGQPGNPYQPKTASQVALGLCRR